MIIPFIYRKTDRIVVYFQNINDLKKAIKLMEESNINKCDIIIDSINHNAELSFIGNLSYLESLLSLNYDINFYYDEVSERKFPLKKIVEDEKLLNLVAKDIKESGLSNLEMFLAIYEIVYFFKFYKKESNEENYTLSRNLYEYLNNSYMVCAGYADLMQNLCERVGIVCFYHVLLPKNVSEDKSVPHVRNCVYLKDDKYNVDGFYISDATSLESMKEVSGMPVINSFSSVLMLPREEREENIYRTFDIFGLSKEEFINESKTNSEYLKRKLIYIFKDIDIDFVKMVSSLDLTIKRNAVKVWNYVFKRFDKKISKNTLVSAFKEVFKFVFKNASELQVIDFEIFCRGNIIFDIEELFNKYDLIFMNLKEFKYEFPFSYSKIIFNYLMKSTLYRYEVSDNGVFFSWSDASESLIVCCSLTYVDIILFLNNGYKEISKGDYILLEFPKINVSDDVTLGEYIDSLEEQINDFFKLFMCR